MSSRKRGAIPEEAGISTRLEKDGYLPENALCVSGSTPKKLIKGEKRVAPSPPEDRIPKKGKGSSSPTYAAAYSGGEVLRRLEEAEVGPAEEGQQASRGCLIV